MTKYTFTFVATAMAASLMSASSASAQQATNIANDGRFWEIVALNHAFSSAFNQTVDQMPPAEADAFVSMLMSDAYMQGDGPSTFFNDYGLDHGPVFGAADLTVALIADHGLTHMSQAQLASLFMEVLSSPVGQQRLMSIILNSGPGGMSPMMLAGQHCRDMCLIQYMIEFATITAGLVSSVASGDTAAIVLSALGSGLAFYLAQQRYSNCLVWCHDEEVHDGQCDTDHDCARDEYCAKGFLGLGINECRPKGNLDDGCTRGKQCLSNCCMLKFPEVWHGLTCHPTSACP